MADRERIKADIEFLRKISEPCEGGTTRLSFTKEYKQGVEYMKTRMADTGLEILTDGIGNIYGKLGGAQAGLPVILSGSHLDTVRCAGAFDGIAGVVCALEAARMLKERGGLRHPFTVMGLVEEEGGRFGQVLLGSQYATGVFGEKELDEFADGGSPLRSILHAYDASISGRPYRANQVIGEIGAFLELHSEQGPVLEREGIDIGIVERIVSISWLTVTVTGFAGHSGTVPMPIRQDAGIGAFRLIDRINRHVTEHYANAATLTVGRLELSPGSANCIPAKCTFSVDLRSGELRHIEDITRYIKEQAGEISGECRVQIEVKVESLKEPVYMDEGLQQMIEKSCETLGYSWRRINSGAGHDAMIFANHTNAAMIFVPCRDGITHHPDELVSWEALAKGTDVLYQTVLQLDRSI